MKKLTLSLLLVTSAASFACSDGTGGLADTKAAEDLAAPDADAELAPDTDPIDATTDLVGPGDTAPSDVSTEEPDAQAADVLSPDTRPADVAPPDDVAADVAAQVPPCAAITILEGLTVSPPAILHLSGDTTTGDAARWQWSIVSAPAHSFTGIAGAHSREATFEAAVAGSYTLRLEAWDEKGQTACDPAEATVIATPTSAIHLELWWDDNNADPTAEFGADLDLHVMHPDAVGIDVSGDGQPDRWFDPMYDVAWHNPSAEWPGPVDDPNGGPIVKLLRRDDSGYGPEVVTIDRPRAGDVYTVGFHIWDDIGSTYLQPTEIRVYIDGVLKNRPNYAVPLRAHILERVMTVRWPFEGQQSLGFPFARDGDMVPTTPTKN